MDLFILIFYEMIQELLYDILLTTKQNLWFMHDGNPHFYFEVRIPKQRLVKSMDRQTIDITDHRDHRDLLISIHYIFGAI